jgi:hypothetical protein
MRSAHKYEYMKFRKSMVIQYLTLVITLAMIVESNISEERKFDEIFIFIQ